VAGAYFQKVGNDHSYHPKMKRLHSVFGPILGQIVASIYFILQFLKLGMVLIRIV
jgi:hypothetical protein